MAAKTFEEWWCDKQELLTKCTDKLGAYAAWEAAYKSAVEKFTSYNSQSMPCCICGAAIVVQAKVICECCANHYYE
jgi:hypothetical protein